MDVGCGNGAFSELLVAHAGAAEVQGIDPSEGQLSFARTRHKAGRAEFRPGSAMELPYPAASFDAATMALVIFFVPEPSVGVAEMVRVVKPGGIVAAYAWDMAGGGFPLEPLQSGLRAMGITPQRPPQEGASRIGAMEALWHGAGLVDVSVREIRVRRHFADFAEYWQSCLKAPSMSERVADMPPEQAAALRESVRASIEAPAEGPFSVAAWANAVKGRVAG